MTLIDNRVSKLCSGYDIVVNAHVRLKEEWHDRLLLAHTQKRIGYDKAHEEYLKRQQDIKKQTPEWLVLSALLFILALFAFLIDAWEIGKGYGTAVGLLLLGSSFLTGLYLVFIWLRHKSHRPQEPVNPLQAGLISPLLPKWKSELNGHLPSQLEYHGAEGEYAFVRHLQRHLDNSHYIIYRLQQRRGDDVDVTVVGSSGIWVFEVKFWAGTVTWQNGQWRHEKTYYEKSGVLATEKHIVKQGPDDQWRRMADDVAKSIRTHASQLVSRFMPGIRTQGGIVFAHETATYHIASNPPVAWGNMSKWSQEIRRAPRIPGWDERTTFIVLDALFTRHHQVVATNSEKSMYVVGQRLIQQTEKGLEAWLIS
ncbi:MAG: NERD domain-containing protein [Anaerolineae bacterium]|nr:NERD domain-containing protein [Anaerolineae bacterium]